MIPEPFARGSIARPQWLRPAPPAGTFERAPSPLSPPPPSMATSKAATVAQYLDELPPDRRAVVTAVRDLVRRHLPAGYEEGMTFGMIGWTVPLARYPNTYNKQPLQYLALAAQKNYYALYVPGAYQAEDGERLREAFARAGKKLDMGKSCLRFRSLDDLPLDAIGEIGAATPPADFVARYEAARAAARPAG